MAPRLCAVLPLLACLVGGAQALGMLQWNPHWECFSHRHPECKRHAEGTVDQLLVEHAIDFANLIELEDKEYKVPHPFEAVAHTCGRDVLTLVHNDEKWSASSKAGATERGCMLNYDRPFLVQQFDERPAYGSRRVVVIAAHYPHGGGHEELRNALASVAKATNVTQVVLIADTNEFRDTPNEQIMGEITARDTRGNETSTGSETLTGTEELASTVVPSGHLRGTKLLTSCCHNNDFDAVHAFDRIIANFGPEMHTEMLLNDNGTLPAWAQAGKMHKPILAEAGPTVTSTTTVTTTATTTTTRTTTTRTTTTTTSPHSGGVTGWIVAGVVVTVLGIGSMGIAYCVLFKPKAPQDDALSMRLSGITTPAQTRVIEQRGGVE